jgi:hypothetical protein
MDHVIQRRDLLIRIGDDGIIHGRLLCLVDVVDPAFMRIQWIHTDGDHFDPALLEVRRNFRHGPELGGADRGVIFWMRKENSPAVAEPLMKVNRPFSCLSREIRSFIS